MILNAYTITSSVLQQMLFCQVLVFVLICMIVLQVSICIP